MIGIELIRSDPERVRRAIEARGDSVRIDRVLDLDVRRRLSVSQVDDLRAARNRGSARLAKMDERPREMIDEMRAVASRIKTLESGLRRMEEELHELLLNLPNIPEDGVPVGRDESENVLVRGGGEEPDFDFEPLPHWELGERLDIIDFKRGVRVSGSRFYVLKGKGARLQRALIAWMLDLHASAHGYEELYLPNIVTQETVLGSGQLPKFRDTMYHDDEDDLWLIPTAEVPITGLYGGEILSADDLPKRYVGPYAVLQAREGGGRQGHARDQAIAPVREGGDVQDRRTGDVFRRAGEPVGRRRGRLQAPGHRAPGDIAVHR